MPITSRRRALPKTHDERRVLASSRIRDITTYDEFSRFVDRTLNDDKLFERIHAQASAIETPANS